MDSHGGLQQLLSRDARGALTLNDVQPGSGFRHFIRQPDSSETFKVFGKDPRDNLEITSALFRKLSKLLDFVDFDRDFWGRNEPGKPAAWENTRIPAGYTYLLQFISHDLVHTSLHTPDPTFDRRELRNHRTEALNLASLYGAEPATCPYAYNPAGSAGVRTHLRLSAFNNTGGSRTLPEHRFRDIGRGVLERDPLSHGKESIPLIADSRNDDNSNISQILTAFIWLHNTVLDQIPPEAVGPTTADAVKPAKKFAIARTISTNLYKKIIEYDLMARVLLSPVHDIYKPSRKPIFDTEEDNSIPVEFSHAAMRFGHTMVRETYKLNNRKLGIRNIEEISRFNSQNEPNEMPLNNDWIIAWSNFFSFDGLPAPNYSRKIGPSFAQGFRFTPRTGQEPVSNRDLLRGAFSNLWSIKSLASAIYTNPNSAKLTSKLLFDPTHREMKIAKWLEKANDFSDSGLKSTEIHHISKDPPLFFYILFEAMEEGSGESLGTLGSILFAETIYRHLPKHEQEYDLFTKYIPEISGIKNMPDLLKFIMTSANLENSDPPFI